MDTTMTVAVSALRAVLNFVLQLHEVLVTFIGPGQAWVIARLDIDDDLRGAQVKSLVRGIEAGMKRESEAVYRVDIVPVGRAQAVT